MFGYQIVSFVLLGVGPDITMRYQKAVPWLSSFG